MSQRDLPIWARGVAAGLLLFASWWLFNTEGIRSVVGDSIGALCLGVIAASILQGMHLPFALWPDGPWRKQFSVPGVVATAAVLAIMILIPRAVRSDVLASQLDVGYGIVVVVGNVVGGVPDDTIYCSPSSTSKMMYPSGDVEYSTA